MLLDDQSLIKDKIFINGEWVEAQSGRRMSVTNPADGTVIGKVPDGDGADIIKAIDAANQAQKSWAQTPARERSQVLRRWFNLMMEAQSDLARLMTYEQGKPLAESKGEIAYGASFLEWYSEECKRSYGDVIPPANNGTRLVTFKQPIGVSAGITPWNFPAAMITRKAGPAIAAGCSFVLKPAEDTPLSALALAELASRAGLPKGVLNIVTSSREHANEIGLEMTTNPIIRKIGFTGSTAVGKRLMEQAAGTVKKVSLELGGNAPFIVFDDADLESAVAGLLICKYRNAGQTCVCANRVLVQDGIYDRFVDLLLKKVSEFKVGFGWEDGVNMGPLINERAIEKVDRLVREAVSAGAKVELGGHPSDIGTQFYTPSVVTNVTPDMSIAFEEIFGPVAGIIRFKSDEDAIRIANDTPFGLAAYFYSRDIGRCWRVGEALEYGMIGVNAGVVSGENVPFGGIKESGIGREGGYQGLEEWMETKYFCMADI